MPAAVSSTPTPPLDQGWPVRRQLRALALLTASLLGLALLVWALPRLLGAKAPPPPPSLPAGTVELSAGQLATLTVETVRLRDFRPEETGEGQIALDADATTPVYSPYSGRVLAVLAAPGDTVEQGRPLLQVEATESAQAQGDLLSSAAALRLARANEQRRHAAYEDKDGSLQDWQQSQSDLSAAEAAYATARNRLRILGESDRGIGAIEQRGRAIGEATVRSPLTGVVTDRQVGPGQYIQAAGGTPLFTIGNPARVWLVANVRETQAPRVKKGQAVEVRVLALPERLFQATISAVGAQLDPVTHRLPVRATLDNRDGLLRPQMFATFSINTGDPHRAPAVPEEALVREGEAAHVWVLTGGTRLSIRPVRTGRSQQGMVEILSGLTAGERVVTHGSLFIDRAAHPG